MSDPHVEAIAEALREATPGPWSSEREESVEMYGDPVHLIGYGEPDGIDAYLYAEDADARLIANAPTWLAQLLAALAKRDAENEQLTQALRRVAGLGMNPWHPGASYEIASAALMNAEMGDEQ